MPEIDGLRAIAVIGVILFHAGMGFSGGYVGVDVFFVISGFLITRIIIRELDSGHFSLTQFWVRRVRRILPAASFVVIFTLLAGLLLLDSAALFSTGKAAIAQALIASNVYFSRQQGYFDASSELNPLLHTWSLSVEEQFYVFYPLLLILLFRFRGRRLIVPGLLALVALSLALSTLTVHRFPDLCFYLLPTRAWEMAAGGLVALVATRLSLPQRTSNVLALSGLAVVVGSMFLFTPDTPFPGIAAAIPVGGTAVFILVSVTSKNIASRLLSGRAVTGIGKISYSLYLWHWPLLVFRKHFFISEKIEHTLAALALTVLFSCLTYRYIENPFRYSRLLKPTRNALVFGAGIALTMVLFGGLLWRTHGLPGRFDAATQSIQADMQWRTLKFESDKPEGVLIGDKLLRPEPDFVYWGDSHGMATSYLIDKLALQRGLSGRALLRRGTPPIPGLWKPFKVLNEKEMMLRLNKGRLDWLIASKSKNLILVARWDAMLLGAQEIEVKNQQGSRIEDATVMDTDDIPPSLENSSRALKRQLEPMLEELSKNGVKVWILLQVPESSRASVSHDFYLIHRYPWAYPDDSRWDTELATYRQRGQPSREIFKRFASPDVVILDPKNEFYGSASKLQLYNKRAFYWDDDHLTEAGNEHYLTGMFSKVLDEIARDNGGK
jgi:peptidoglycan/LPS O-acetylase OafA/YrhL